MKKDLSNLLTVFVQAAGSNPNYPDCIRALEEQTVSFKLDIVKDLHPISGALEEMAKRCTTPFYLGVDEDMILFPDSVQSMFNVMQASSAKTAIVVFLLRDIHLDMRIFGVKMYRTEITRQFPYNSDTIVCDAEQVSRITKAGYEVGHRYVIMGEHSPKWNKRLIFERYLNLMEKYKQFGYDWIRDVPAKLRTNYQSDPSEINLYAILGAYTSMITEAPVLIGEKDFNNMPPSLEILGKMLPL